MRKLFILLLYLSLLYNQCAKCEIFVDYEPESLKNPIQKTVSETKSVQVQQQTSAPPKEQVPALPAHLKNDVNRSSNGVNISPRSAVNVKESTKFEIAASQNFSDKTKENTKIKFVTKQAQSAGSVMLPAGTIFSGHIVQSHSSQLTSNGGLIKVVIDEIIYENVSNDINSKVISVNGKRIYFNNIKGQRMYLSNTAKNTQWGRKFCKKTYQATSSLYKKGGVCVLISPIPAVCGTAVCALNCVGAPIIAIFQKGGSINIKKGAMFKIKLNEDAKIYVLK